VWGVCQELLELMIPVPSINPSGINWKQAISGIKVINTQPGNNPGFSTSDSETGDAREAQTLR